MSAFSPPRILKEPVFCRFSSLRYTSRPASPESASDFSVGVRRMCGPIAAAASATEDASSVLTATAVMLPSPARSCVSVRGRSLVDVIGVVEEVDIPWRLPEPRQQHGGVAELLLGVRVDVEHVVPERKTLLRRRARLEVVDLLQRVVVERREPRAHFLLVAAPMVDEVGRSRIVGGRELLLPFGLGLVL